MAAFGWRWNVGVYGALTMDLTDEPLTRKIIACAYAVHNVLGPGFLEKVYENAIAVELGVQELAFRRQAPLSVTYRNQVVGEYFADLLVEGTVLCELKAVESLSKYHEVQLVNYLVATGIDTGLLINFGNSVTVRRKHRTLRKTANPAQSCTK